MDRVAVASPAGHDVVQLLELPERHRADQLVRAVVGRRLGDLAALVGPVIHLVGEQGRLVGEGVVVGEDHSRVAGADVLEVVQAEGPDRTHRSGEAALVFAQVALGEVLDHGDVFRGGEFEDRIHVRRHHGELHEHDRLRVFGDLRFDRFGGHHVGVGIEVGEDGHGVLIEDADHRAHVADGRGNRLVADADVQEPRDVDRGGSAGDHHAMLHAVALGEGLAKPGDLCALGVEEAVLRDCLGEVSQLRLTPAMAGAVGRGLGGRAAVEGEFRLVGHRSSPCAFRGYKAACGMSEPSPAHAADLQILERVAVHFRGLEVVAVEHLRLAKLTAQHFANDST